MSSGSRTYEDEDVSRDFCCFMCNGRQILHGYVTLYVSFIRLTMFDGRILEEFEYGTVYSVNEEEPPTTHSLVINLPHHSVYLCHLLRKALLLRVFQKLELYKPDVRLPAESLGFPTGGLAGMSCSPNVARLVYPKPGLCHHHHDDDHHHHDDECSSHTHYEEERHSHHYDDERTSHRHYKGKRSGQWTKTGSQGKYSALDPDFSDQLSPT